MTDAILHDLFGSCACERNQYAIVVPVSEAQKAQVFFDNSAASCRAQAAPVTAWLRVPLQWYRSYTIARFEDESHVSIKRSFYAPSSRVSQQPWQDGSSSLRTRRQFCGYCGTHLTKLEEDALLRERNETDRDLQEEASIDVTLGSLERASLEDLETLGILNEDGDDEGEANDGDPDELVDGREFPQHTAEVEAGEGFLTRNATINDEDHIDTNETSMTGVDATTSRPSPTAVSSQLIRNPPPHRMHHRGIPYFESMVEDSRLGRIKRQGGAHTSRDGTITVQWEIVQMGDEDEVATGASEERAVSDRSSKRQKTGT